MHVRMLQLRDYTMSNFFPVSHDGIVLVCITSMTFFLYVLFFFFLFNSFRFPHKNWSSCCACGWTIFGAQTQPNIQIYSQHANGSHIWKWERERCDVSFRIHAFYFIRCVLKLIFVFFFSLFIVNIFESHKHFKHFNDNNNERKRRRKAREKNNNCKTMLRWRQAI